MRLELTRRADLAARTMVLLAERGRLKASELAEALDTTAGFVPQVVGPLTKAGWVRSDPGPTGGYALNVELDLVTLLEVIEAADGPTDSGRCVVLDRPCDVSEPCSVHFAWTEARRVLTGILADTRLSDLAAVAQPTPAIPIS